MMRITTFLLITSASTAAYTGDPAFYDNERLNHATHNSQAVEKTLPVASEQPETRRAGDPSFYDNERINSLLAEDDATARLIMPVAVQIVPAGGPAFYDNEPQRLKSGVR